jgi:hypothetical protein
MDTHCCSMIQQLSQGDAKKICSARVGKASTTMTQLACAQGSLTAPPTRFEGVHAGARSARAFWQTPRGPPMEPPMPETLSPGAFTTLLRPGMRVFVPGA